MDLSLIKIVSLCSVFIPWLSAEGRYLIIYFWKILLVENIVPNFSDPIGHFISERRGGYCKTSHIELGRLGSLHAIQ